MSTPYSGNEHKQHDCPYCWRVLYSRGALTKHLNSEHWDMRDEEDIDPEHPEEPLELAWDADELA